MWTKVEECSETGLDRKSVLSQWDRQWQAREDLDQHFQYGNERDILNAQKLWNPGSYLYSSVWLKKVISITHQLYFTDLPNSRCLALCSFSLCIFNYIWWKHGQGSNAHKYFNNKHYLPIKLISTKREMLSIILLLSLTFFVLVWFLQTKPHNGILGLYSHFYHQHGYWITFTLHKKPMLIWTRYVYQINVIQVKIGSAFHQISLTIT